MSSETAVHSLLAFEKFPRAPHSLLKRFSVLCWILCLIRIALPMSLVVRQNVLAANAGHNPDVEFVYFYSMGRLFNQYAATQVYDYSTQQKVCKEVRPAKHGQYGPNPFAPFLGVLFRPLAAMTFGQAYVAWLLFSLTLYTFGLWMFVRRFLRNDNLRWLLVCTAFFSMPFVWTLTGGQVSHLAFFAFALAFCAEHDNRPFTSGLALSLCLYKPTTLVLFLPMLVITRRYRSLAGFATGAGALALFTTAIEGVRIWPGYVRLMLSFAGGVFGNHTQSAVASIWYYADLLSFFTLMRGGRGWIGIFALSLLAISAGSVLVWMWHRSSRAGRAVQALAGSATLTWTLLLNAYSPIYDSGILVLSIVATLDVLRRTCDKKLQRWLMFFWLLILVGSWLTVPFAQRTGFQLLTVLILCLGILQLVAFKRQAAQSNDSSVLALRR